MTELFLAHGGSLPGGVIQHKREMMDISCLFPSLRQP